MPTRVRSRRSNVARSRYERNPSRVSSRGRIGDLVEDLAEQLEQRDRRFLARVPPEVVRVLLGVARARGAGGPRAAITVGPEGTDVHEEGERVGGAPAQLRVGAADADGQIQVRVA